MATVEHTEACARFGMTGRSSWPRCTCGASQRFREAHNLRGTAEQREHRAAERTRQRSVVDAVFEVIGTVNFLRPREQAMCAEALVLARRMDDPGTPAGSLAGISKQLQVLLDALHTPTVLEARPVSAPPAVPDTPADVDPDPVEDAVDRARNVIATTRWGEAR